MQRATKTVTFSTSQLPKVFRASLRRCVHFDFEVCFARQRCVRALSNLNFQKCSRPDFVIFCTFLLGHVFAPQRRVLFEQLNFQKWSEHVVFSLFRFGNVPRNTVARILPHLSFQKCSTLLCARRARNFSSLISPDGYAPACLASLFFDPSEPQNIGKTSCFATLLPCRTPASTFF